MAPERRLATFVHVSDVHFGDLDARTGSATLDARAADWWRTAKIFDGYLGHGYDALVHLTDFFHRLRREEEAQLIITGDLTAAGKASQFALARTFFEGAIQLDPGNPVGLGLHDGLRRAIPGNHDHWPGTRMVWGAPTEGLAATFPEVPIPIDRVPLGDGRVLVFAGIDTDADVRPTFPGTSRLFGRGKFVSQLQALDHTLGTPRDDEIRVLLMHHSRLHRSFAQGIVASSRTALDAFIERRDVAVLLTGHVHRPFGEVFEVGDRDGVSWEVLEARCGTTTQRDELPLDWVAAGGAAATIEERLPPNTLLVHRLVETQDGRVEWRAYCFRRSRTKGFCNDGLLIGTRPVTVWPRPWRPS